MQRSNIRPRKLGASDKEKILLLHNRSLKNPVSTAEHEETKYKITFPLIPNIRSIKKKLFRNPRRLTHHPGSISLEI